MLNDYLAEFVVVAREGSLAKAALELSLAQSSLSRHLKTLESSLGIKLLNRSPTGMTLTDDGRQVFRYAANILEQVENIEEFARSRRQAQSLSVGGLLDFPSIAMTLREAGEARVVGGKPNPAEVKFTDLAVGKSIQDALEDNTYSLFITYASDEQLLDLGEECRVAPFAHPGVVAVMDKTHPLAQRSVLRPEDLDGQILLTAESNYMRAKLDWIETRKLLKEHGVSFYVQGGAFTSEADWYFDFGRGILLLPEGHRGLQVNTSLGKVAIPVESLHHTLAAVYRADDALAEWFASVDIDGTLGYTKENN